MDSVSCDLKVHLSLLLLLCLLEKMQVEEHCVEKKNYGYETFHTQRSIRKKRSNPFFYLCLGMKSQFLIIWVGLTRG